MELYSTGRVPFPIGLYCGRTTPSLQTVLPAGRVRKQWTLPALTTELFRHLFHPACDPAARRLAPAPVPAALTPPCRRQNVPVANAQPDDIKELLGGALFKELYKWMLESGPVYLLPTGGWMRGWVGGVLSK